MPAPKRPRHAPAGREGADGGTSQNGHVASSANGHVADACMFCARHWCAHCKTEESKGYGKAMVHCVRCPTSYHRRTPPPQSRSNLGVDLGTVSVSSSQELPADGRALTRADHAPLVRVRTVRLRDTPMR